MNPCPIMGRQGDWTISGDRQDGTRFVVTMSDHRIRRVRSGTDSIGQLIDAVLQAALVAEDQRLQRQRQQVNLTEDLVSYGVQAGMIDEDPVFRVDPNMPDNQVLIVDPRSFTDERVQFNGNLWPLESADQYMVHYDPITGTQNTVHIEGDLCYDTTQISSFHIQRRVAEAVEANRRLAEIAARRELIKPIAKKQRRIRV
jgi:hypothetical protein